MITRYAIRTYRPTDFWLDEWQCRKFDTPEAAESTVNALRKRGIECDLVELKLEVRKVK